MMKIAGSESGSISQRHGSADPDPHQNVMDPQHCIKDSQNKLFLGSCFCYVPVISEVCEKFDDRIALYFYDYVSTS